MAFAKARDSIQATVFDLSNVVSLAQGYIEEEGLSHRIDTLAGDYNKDELPQGYDLAFLPAIIHSNSFKQNQSLFLKIGKALTPLKNIFSQYRFDSIAVRVAHAGASPLILVTGMTCL